MKKITCWQGQNVEELSRDELLSALLELVRENDDLRDGLNHSRQVNVGMMRKAAEWRLSA